MRVFRNNHHCSKFDKFHRKTPVLEFLFFLKIMKLYKDICSAHSHKKWKVFLFLMTMICMNKSYLCRNFLLIDWHHKRLKNTIDLLLFYGEHFYRFLEIDLWKIEKKKHSFHNKHIYIYGHRHFEVLWSFILYFVHIVKVCFDFKEQLLWLYSSIYE